MKELIVPEKIQAGDTVAFISLSGGRAGDQDMRPRYDIGKRRFEEMYQVHVIETPHALAGSEYLYNPLLCQNSKSRVFYQVRIYQ